MPKLSPTMDEGQISRWVKNEGESFESGETLAEVDTDKATMEMTALSGGTLLKILKAGGESAKLGEPIAIIGKEGEDISALLAELDQPEKGKAIPKMEQPEEVAKKAEDDKPSDDAKASDTKRSVGEPEEPKAESSNGRLMVSPIAARMAADNNIDLRSLTGSGPNGRIIKRDIEAVLSSEKPAADAKSSYSAASQAGASEYRDEPTSKMRQVIATRLAESIGPIPTFYLTVEIEMDDLLTTRKKLNAALSEDEKISVNDIIVKAAAASLVRHRFVNASYRGDSIRFFEQADVGVAVAVDEGLITPVVRAADKKGLAEISAEIKQLAEKAKAKKLQPDEYTGATFSISNLGMMGIKEFTAIINPPESGILAIGGSTPTAVVRDGQIVIRNIMNVTMSCDHRVIDGATGAKFLQTFKQMLENPAMMLL